MAEDLHILLTGDCWNSEISNCLVNSPFTVTFRALDKVLASPVDNRWGLVVLGSSRRGQFTVEQGERLLEKFVNVPVVGLSGSWCEGESRSGVPIPGLIRIYWHQWLGRLDLFFEQIEEQGRGTWHMPKIATTADRILDASANPPMQLGDGSRIAISALTKDRFSMLEDAVVTGGSEAVWLESLDSEDESASSFSAICIEGNSLSEQLCRRVERYSVLYREVPIVLILNFPRQSDIEKARRMGIHAVVSKPFQLADLYQAIARTVCIR